MSLFDGGVCVGGGGGRATFIVAKLQHEPHACTLHYATEKCLYPAFLVSARLHHFFSGLYICFLVYIYFIFYIYL